MSVGRIRIATSLILIASILLLPGSLVAQTSTAPVNDWSRLAAVEPGSKLSIKLKDGKKVEGKLNGFTDSALSLSIKNKTVEVKREEVRSIHQVKRKSATTSTLIGMGVGAGAGAALGAVGRANDDDTGFDFDKLENAIHAGLVVAGAGVGAITGFFVGRSRRKRVLIYESTQP
jgi:small nuclear ribonucleoprotein (snRNP)-like protein